MWESRTSAIITGQEYNECVGQFYCYELVNVSMIIHIIYSTYSTTSTTSNLFDMVYNSSICDKGYWNTSNDI